jgi:hypothetical protein
MALPPLFSVSLLRVQAQKTNSENRSGAAATKSLFKPFNRSRACPEGSRRFKPFQEDRD